MIRNVRHTGLVIRNAAKSRSFYEGLGFVVENHANESGEFISHVVGIVDVQIETIKMRSPDGSMIELLEYHSHPDRSPQVKSPANKLGCSHLAFTVNSILDTCRVIEELGGSVVNPPVVSKDGNVSVAYCYDNDGILLEIVEEISRG